MMKICTGCGSLYSDLDHTCQRCGAEVCDDCIEDHDFNDWCTNCVDKLMDMEICGYCSTEVNCREMCSCCGTPLCDGCVVYDDDNDPYCQDCIVEVV